MLGELAGIPDFMLPDVFLTSEDESTFRALPCMEQLLMCFLLRDIKNHKALALTFTEELGWGVTAREEIDVGESITVLDSPDWVTIDEIRMATDAIDAGLLDPAALKILYDVIQVEEDRYLLPTPTVGFLFNHSCAPNAVLLKTQNGFEFRAVRWIAANEEIRWNYATTMGDWFTMQCKCESDCCFGLVAGPLSLSLEARAAMLEEFGEEQLLPHVVQWLRRDDCPAELTGERYLRDFEGEDAKKIEILTGHPRLHPEVHRRVQGELVQVK